ncbi:sushi, von Willebrand factor type A, EGF and pentraxin domain-containing protein 1-like [Anthonomus grandis grandis]|uniref:sushi, von Willebrand factor type A, EGF and pentraxin domain-containing protein 1-like n=1 Tax=Anthonomus grandis grandis TaxID=2921223 RepID=UPI0021653E04|nr:sushi, von Willebrand factor type A, EGF and pentraxin domain-containing protein 1-like [Anthonomus grandis grandis]
MGRFIFLIFVIILLPEFSFQEKLNLDALNNYSEFLNFGNKKLHKIKSGKQLENQIFKSKLDVLGELFKRHVDFLKVSQKLDIVFLVDASSSVGDKNFLSELKFIKKLLSDITVDYNHTRVAVVSFSSPSNTIKNIDGISLPSKDHDKCFLLNDQLMSLEYTGGETYTVGAFQKAKEIFDSSHRNDSKKIIFLVTDGYSNGEDPVPLSIALKNNQTTIFTIGIRNGNYKELYELSSNPGEFYSYLLDSFEEFEGLARRALHVDLSDGDYIPLGVNQPCNKLCEEGEDCCDQNAQCSCGTTTGHYSCTCQPGYYGSGLKNDCMPCTAGTYSDGPNLCLPCPDIQHITIPPASGIESCTCKKGFQDDGKGGCKILKCPKIDAPEHGYIVKKKECNNVLNSACGMRCEVGYTMVGNSIRLCQANATWSGSDPTCEVKTCNKPPTPKYGSVECKQEDLGVIYDKSEKKLPVDTICTFECDKGHLLIGSHQRTCLPIAQWDGLRTICKQTKCSKLSQINYARIEPRSCTSGKQDYGKSCKIVCRDGFWATGPTDKVCGSNGLWGKKHEDETFCIDVTPPDLDCPNNVTGNTIPGAKYGQVAWQEPVITDNSGQNVTSWIRPTIVKPADYKFTIGSTRVTYFAQDVFNNVAKCHFYVEIIDIEPPTIEGCISPPPYESKSKENITWDEPNIFDNSQNVIVTKSHEFGSFEVGTTEVTYTANDSSGNVNICRINITVEEFHCLDLISPLNGQLQCETLLNNSVKCILSCAEGYAIPLPISDLENNSTTFFCNHAEALWFNEDGLDYPECSAIVNGESEKKGNVDMDLGGGTSCNNTDEIEKIQNNLKSTLENLMCYGDCLIDLQSECKLEEAEEDTNELASTKRRKKREEEVVSKRIHKKRKNRLSMKFQVKGKYINETNLKEVNVPGLNGTMRLEKAKFICPNGFIPRKNRCVQCPRGTFHNITTNICQSCDFGSYNDKVGQTSCIVCPEHHSTRKMHVKSFSECREMCPPGTYARKKKIKVSRQSNNTSTIERATLSPYCKSCPVGSYQAGYGTFSCNPCPNGFTTAKVHSTSFKDCIPKAKDLCNLRLNICNNGKCIIENEYEFSCECFDQYYGPYCKSRFSPCDSQPCQNNGTCITNSSGYSCTCAEGYFGRQCENVLEKDLEIPCNLKCENGGTCLNIEENELVCVCPPGFYGDLCQQKMKFCDNLVCENNSTCTETSSSFICACAKGFMGRRCNLVPCDYKPCTSNNSICVNLEKENTTRSDYKCVCAAGFTGPDCQQKIDYCQNLPCQNNGLCRNGEFSYKCLCPKLYYGENCEFTRDTNLILQFSSSNINDFVRWKGFEKNLSEISICLWMQTNDDFNYGTLVSYANKFTDNAFTLTDYTGLVFYINKQHVVTDVVLNDGFWHHVCSMWSSDNGAYQIFVDGAMVKNGIDLAPYTQIEADGYFVIGQEQDSLGGRFSQSESFVGNLAYVDVWSRVLTFEEILAHQNDCNDVISGDVYAWAEVADHIYGNIQQLPSHFCQICEDPEPLFHGFVHLQDNRAYYSCYEGYELSNSKFANGRRCTKTSKWEGFYEPYCKKVNCGYPGIVKNAYSIGNRYFYNDKVTYQCYDGFKMIGNMTIICKEDGKWFPEKPQCVGIQCTLPIVPNGKVQIISDLFEESGKVTMVDTDTQISVMCYDNATLIGDDVATCLENGTWDNSNLTCQPKQPKRKEIFMPKSNCPMTRVPKAPENGYIDDDSLSLVKNGLTDWVEYKCRPGFYKVGVSRSTCIVDGYWTEINMTCEAITCDRPPSFENMVLQHKELLTGKYIFGNLLTYECKEGFFMVGRSLIRCTTFGRWSKMQGRCIKISCDKPKLSLDARIIGNSYFVGDSVTIICPNKAEFTLICGKNGTWDGDIDPKC